MRTHTEKEKAAKMDAKNILQDAKNLQSLTIDGVAISVVNGTLKTDWQLEEDKQTALLIEKMRQKKIKEYAESLLARWEVKKLEAIQIEDVHLEKKDGKLEIIDPWDI